MWCGVAEWPDLKPGTSIFSQAMLRYVREIRTAMFRGLSGETLAAALAGFERGYLQQAANMWQPMAKRDDMISIVKPKREKSVSRREWQVLTVDDSRAAKAQKQVLTDFWNNVRAVNAFDLNHRGGFALLVRQMMESVSFQYANHHLVWKPSRDRLDCSFEYVPLQFFENRTGLLRFCQTGFEVDGQEMPEGEWMTTVGDGLMIAGSIGYLCKRNALADLLAFSDKFGMPGFLGRTKHGKDTPGGIAMAEAVEAFGQDWAAVLYGDDGTVKDPIQLIRAEGGTGSLPMPAIIDRVDKRFAALWRGADLSTMSAKDNTGASLQGGETDLIEQDDALTISEKLNEIERIVLGFHFGAAAAATPKAYIRLIVPQSEDLKLLLEVVAALVPLGAPIAINEILERFGLAQPKEGEELLKAKAMAAPADPAAAQDATRLNADANEEKFLAGASRLLAKAGQEDRAELIAQMKSVLRAPDGTRLNALADFVAQLPESIGKDSAQVRAWETLMASALVNGWATNSNAS
jgi:phage gp29-like protein